MLDLSLGVSFRLSPGVFIAHLSLSVRLFLFVSGTFLRTAIPARHKVFLGYAFFGDRLRAWFCTLPPKQLCARVLVVFRMVVRCGCALNL
jgi:hypothetical protein